VARQVHAIRHAVELTSLRGEIMNPIDAVESHSQAIDDFDRCDFFELRFHAIPPQDPYAHSLAHEFICHEGTCEPIAPVRRDWYRAGLME
jgi:hypothetical protein